MSDTTPTGPGGSPAPDEAFDRLRAADPARTLEPDLDRLRADVATRIAADDGAPAVPDQLAERRARRWTAPLIAGVAASALLVGGLGFGLGRVGGGSGIPPAGGVIVLSAGEASGDASGAGAPEMASTGALAEDARLSIWPPAPWRTVFTASGLSDETGRAQAWAFDPAAVFSAASATAAAAALGLEGEARQDYGAWVVGAQDGTSASLSLQPDGYASLSFYDPTRDPYSCVTPTEAARGGAEGRPRCAEGSAEPAPRGAEAAIAMRDLLAAVGLEVSVEIETSELDVPEDGAPRQTNVTAYQVLGAQRTGVSWTAMFAGGGVQSFYGPLAPVVALGEYDVISENAAVARLGDPRFGATWGGVMPLAERAAADLGVASDGALSEGMVSGGGVSEGSGTETRVAPDRAASEPAVVPGPTDRPTVPTAPEPGVSIPWPVTEVTISGARLGLTLQWLPAGAAVLLPAYELTDDDGAAWSVVAVADEGLDFSATP